MYSNPYKYVMHKKCVCCRSITWRKIIPPFYPSSHFGLLMAACSPCTHGKTLSYRLCREVGRQYSLNIHYPRSHLLHQHTGFCWSWVWLPQHKAPGDDFLFARGAIRLLTMHTFLTVFPLHTVSRFWRPQEFLL